MNLFIHFITTFTIATLMSLVLAPNMVLAHSRTDTNDWGYIRIDNLSLNSISTKCYNRYGKGGKWRKTPGRSYYDNHFRSCHGAYIRIDYSVNNKKTVTRFWRNHFNCGSKGLRLEFHQGSSAEPAWIRANCR